MDLSTIRGWGAVVTLAGMASVAHGGATQLTDAAPMMTGRNLHHTSALLTVGEFVFQLGGGLYQFTGIPDGIGAYALDDETVRIFVNHEFSAGNGTSFWLASGAIIPDGARVSYFDIDREGRYVRNGGQAIQRIIDWTGAEVTPENVDAFGVFNRLCSSNMHGAKEGFADDLYFTGEESGGGRMFVLDAATLTMYELADFGNGAWENVTVIPTVGTPQADLTVMLLSDDSAGRPAYLYVGEKNADSDDVLVRNGLVGGQLYTFCLDSGANTNVEFQGNGTAGTGTWKAIESNDPDADNFDNMVAIVTEAGAKGAFFFSRPEDVAYDPRTLGNGTAVFASTGRVTNLGDIDGDGSDDEINDPWGTTYVMTVDLASLSGDGDVTGSMRIIYDGNETGDMGLRSPDNLDWADDGFLYIQEDRSVGGFGAESGREASIWRLDADVPGEALHIAEMDRTAVPEGQSDSDPDDLGDWESSGILDVSELFGEPGGSLFLFDIQAHSIRDGIIEKNNLVQGGQLLFMQNGAVTKTPERPMILGTAGYETDALLTVGEQVAQNAGGLYQFTGIPDGIGVIPWDADTVRAYVNHEFSASAGAPWTLANGTVVPSGARITSLDIRTADGTIRNGEQAIKWIVNWQGNVANEANIADFAPLNRFCSGSAFGPADGFAEWIYFTGEETGGGRQFALEADTGILWELADFGNGAWENTTVIPTVGTAFANFTVMLLADDSAGRPAYLYVGEKSSTGGFLERNGLVGGQLYTLVTDTPGQNTNVEFQGTGNLTTATWVPLTSNDPSIDGDQNMANLVAEAGSLGAFFFSRPEDVAFDPTRLADGRVVFASTGRVTNLGDLDGDGADDEINDPWGTTYLISTDLSSLGDAEPLATLKVLYDGNDADKQDFGIRSPDNLDWADDGFIYIQEDRSIGSFGDFSGREASVWRLSPQGVAVRVAEMDRSAVPAGMSDNDPTDIGEWESSGIVDVSSLFGRDGGQLFLLDVQAHSIRDGIIAQDDLVEGGQVLFMDAAGVVFCPLDLDGDGTVGLGDLLIVASSFGGFCNDCPADINQDGLVDFLDLVEILENWGDCS
jgi:secreted PhoX family phosphatase